MIFYSPPNTSLYYSTNKPNTMSGYRSIENIAIEILDIWNREFKGQWRDKFVAATPYLETMIYLRRPEDSYGSDSAIEIVARFLSNATTWKGEDARRIKKELNNVLNSQR